jgi:hypothetical protein
MPEEFMDSCNQRLLAGHGQTSKPDLIKASDCQAPAPSYLVTTDDDAPVARDSIDDWQSANQAIDYPLRLQLIGMKIGYQAHVKLLNMDDVDGWAIGDRCDRLVGISLKFTSSFIGMNLNGFVIKPREFFICVQQDCEQIDVCLYVRTKRSMLRGSVRLPQGGTVTLESSVDRASLVGMSSFGIALY